MQGFALLLLLFVAVIALTIRALVRAQPARSRVHGLDFARALGGWYLPEDASISPHVDLDLTYAGHLVRLRQAVFGKAPYVQITLFLDSANPEGRRLVISPGATLPQQARLLAMEDYEVGDPFFDARFAVRTNVPEAIPLLLGHRTRHFVSELADLARHDELWISMDRRSVVLRSLEDPSVDGGFRMVFGLAVYLFDAVLEYLKGLPLDFDETDATDLDWSALAAAAVPSTPLCCVCGEAADRDPVACTSCGAVHHRACWAYNGRCAAYPCACTTAT